MTQRQPIRWGLWIPFWIGTAIFLAFCFSVDYTKSRDKAWCEAQGMTYSPGNRACVDGAGVLHKPGIDYPKK